MIGKKGKIIRTVKRKLGKFGALIWRDTKIIGVTEDNTLLAHMCKAFHVRQTKGLSSESGVIVDDKIGASSGSDAHNHIGWS